MDVKNIDETVEKRENHPISETSTANTIISAKDKNADILNFQEFEKFIIFKKKL